MSESERQQPADQKLQEKAQLQEQREEWERDLGRLRRLKRRMQELQALAALGEAKFPAPDEVRVAHFAAESLAEQVMCAEIDKSLEASQRHGARIDLLLEQIQATRAATVV